MLRLYIISGGRCDSNENQYNCVFLVIPILITPKKNDIKYSLLQVDSELTKGTGGSSVSCCNVSRQLCLWVVSTKVIGYSFIQYIELFCYKKTYYLFCMWFSFPLSGWPTIAQRVSIAVRWGFVNKQDPRLIKEVGDLKKVNLCV
jgi:hypothetical protein